MWCDSQIVLSWIKTTSRSLPRFEANRVSTIHTLIPESVWNYINTKENPADIATRGVSPDSLLNCKIWWQGPDWLHNYCNAWQGDTISTVVCLNVKAGQVDIFSKFSKFNKLKR
ncbi:hypothetical protein ILUMI_15606, partial [Ignelater luminosus]